MPILDNPAAKLKVLVLDGDHEKWRLLRARLAKSEGEELCVHRAVLAMGLMVLCSFVGLGYCAILLPEFSSNFSQRILRSVFALGLASLFCQMVFLGCWVWYRRTLKTTREECHSMALSLAGAHLDELDGPGASQNLQDRFLAAF